MKVFSNTRISRLSGGVLLALAVSTTCSFAADLPPQVVDQGEGWELMLVAPPIAPPMEIQTTSLDPAPIVSVSSLEGLAASPLPQSIKDELAADFAAEPDVVLNVRQDLAQAMADGTAAELFAQYIEPDDAGEAAGFGTKFDLNPLCPTHWRERHITRSKSFDGFHHTFSESAGNFRGNIDIDVPLTGDASVDVTYAFRKNSICIPWAVKFVNARATGVLNVGETMFEANGSASFEKSDRRVLLTPKFEENFMVGPVPVRLGVEFPLGVGYDVKATAEAQLALKSRAQGEMRFDVTCTRHGCARNAPPDNVSTVTFQDLIRPSIVGSAKLQVDVKPYAFVEANAWLYHDQLAKAGLGLELSVPSRLFYHYGSGCGSPSGSGSTDHVNGGFVDVNAQLALYYNTTLLGQDRFNWIDTPISSIGGYFHEYRVNDFLRGGDPFNALRHTLYFQPIKVGSSGVSPLTPMLTGPNSVNLGTTGNFAAKMRPCVPLDEPMSYVVDWGDGSQSSGEGPAKQDTPLTHSWTTSGTKSVRVTATQDRGPRTINQQSTRSVVSNALAAPPTPGSISAPANDGDAGFSVSWGTVLNAERYEIERSTAGGAFTQIAVVDHPASSKALTAQPFGYNTYRVRAVNNFGASGYRTAGQTLVGYIPATPGLTVTSLMCQGWNNASWTSSANTTAYKLYWSASSNPANATELYSGLGLSRDVNVSSRTYLWVKACGTGGCSALSPSRVADVRPGSCN